VNEPETIHTILENTQTIAVVGLSDSEDRASYSVSLYMQRQGYRIVPVNPALGTCLGEKAYPTLEAAAANGRIDLVNVFRAPQYIPGIVEDVIRLKIAYLWLQQGASHDEAALLAETSGVKVVMDRCIYLEHARSS
jgi:predicted CoA-binding protein